MLRVLTRSACVNWMHSVGLIRRFGPVSRSFSGIPRLVDSFVGSFAAGTLPRRFSSEVSNAATFESLEKYESLIDEALSGGNTKKASLIFRDLLTARINPSPKVLRSLLLGFAKIGWMPEITSLVSEGVKKFPNAMSVGMFNDLFEALLQSEAGSRQVSLLYPYLLSISLLPTNKTYTLLVTAAVRTGDMHRAERLLLEMRRGNVTPEPAAYAAVIKGWGKQKFLQRAWNVLQQMKLVGIQPDVEVYASLVDACATVADLNLAMHAFKALCALEAASPPLPTINQVLRMCRDLGRYSAANDVWQLMRQARVQPDTESYALMIDLSIEHGAPNGPVRLVEDMLVNGVYPTRKLLSAVVTHCRHYKLHEDARRLAIELDRLPPDENLSLDENEKKNLVLPTRSLRPPRSTVVHAADERFTRNSFSSPLAGEPMRGRKHDGRARRVGLAAAVGERAASAEKLSEAVLRAAVDVGTPQKSDARQAKW